MTFDTILVPHDGSPLSGAVITVLGPLVGEGTKVILLHVRDDEATDDEGLLKAEQELERLGATTERRDVDSPDAAGAILDTADALQPDLIAMTTHGRSEMERWVRGSVAERVLRASPVPLLMVNPFVRDPGQLSSILVPLDTSETSAEVLDVVVPLARAFNASLTLLFVDWNDPTDTPKARAARRAQRARDIATWLAKPRATARAGGVAVDLEIAHGDVGAQILRLADSGSHDLLAMTTHGRSGPGRWILGSIAERVLRECRIPTLLKRTVSQRTCTRMS